MNDHNRRMANQQHRMHEERRMRRNREDAQDRIHNRSHGTDEPISEDAKGGKWIVVAVLILGVLLIAFAEFVITFLISYFAP